MNHGVDAWAANNNLIFPGKLFPFILFILKLRLLQSSATSCILIPQLLHNCYIAHCSTTEDTQNEVALYSSIFLPFLPVLSTSTSLTLFENICYEWIFEIPLYLSLLIIINFSQPFNDLLFLFLLWWCSKT